MEWKLKEIKTFGNGLNKLATWIKGENEIVISAHQVGPFWIWTVNGKSFDEFRPRTDKMNILLDEILVTTLEKQMKANKL
jgi:hypothetical protein